MNELELIPQLKCALPEEFEFYHLGQVKLSHGLDPSLEPILENESREVIWIQAFGDFKAALVFLFDFHDSEQKSTYFELANVLASRWATRLCTLSDLDLMITPPEVSSTSQIKKTLQVNHPEVRSLYLHQHLGKEVPVEMLIFISSKEQMRNV